MDKKKFNKIKKRKQKKIFDYLSYCYKYRNIILHSFLQIKDKHYELIFNKFKHKLFLETILSDGYTNE